MLMKASQTGKAISRVLVQTADWHYREAYEWYDMYNHCLTEGATFLDGDNEVPVPDGLIHPDFIYHARRYLAQYLYHVGIADTIMTTGKGVVKGDWLRPKPTQTAGFAEEFEKAVEQRGQIAKQVFEARRRKNVQRTSTNGQGALETLH